MKIQRLYIENFKSIGQLEIIRPNPFSVFVGANAAGKSNIFEALEFVNFNYRVRGEVDSLFGGHERFLNIHSDSNKFNFEYQFEKFTSSLSIIYQLEHDNSYQYFPNFTHRKNFIEEREVLDRRQEGWSENNELLLHFYHRFTRVFVGNHELQKMPVRDESRLSLSTDNLEKVLKRILKDDNIKEEFVEWLQLFIPEFSNIEIHSDQISGIDTFLIYEKYSKKPFTKALISDGTYNILALLTAVFQHKEPQFLCIEEPENGLNPKVVRELVGFFRQQCEEKGHYIWLNTHSQTLVAELKPEEIILVDKKQGNTVVKQVRDMNLHGLPMDEAWLTNALGGGLPW